MQTYGKLTDQEANVFLGNYLSTLAHEGVDRMQPAAPVTIVVPFTAAMRSGFGNEDVRIAGLRYVAALFQRLLRQAEAADPQRNMPVTPPAPTPLNHDHDSARSVHRVVRAMHDGECPKCHRIVPAKSMEVWPADLPSSDPRQLLGHKCRGCGFEIPIAVSRAALEEFAPFMARNLEVFENWRAGLHDEKLLRNSRIANSS
jgi:hypothetical protein